MSKATKRRKAGQARSALARVQPKQVKVMTELALSEPETLAEMTALVARMSAGLDPEIGAYAAVIAPAMWQARRNGAAMHAVVSGAIGKARRAVALAHGDHLRNWDMFGDMTELAVVEETRRDYFSDDDRTTLSHYGTAPADSQFCVTYGDAVTTALGMVDPAPRVTLARMATEYVRHERSACCSGAGARVTLLGITAHLAGYESRSADYYRARRVAQSVVAQLPARDDVLAVTGAPGARPTYGRNGVSIGNNSPGAESVRVWRRGAVCWVRNEAYAKRASLAIVDEMGYPVSLGYGAPVSPYVALPRPARVLAGATVRRSESRAVDWEWRGSLDCGVTVWRDGEMVRRAVGMGSIMPRRVAGMAKDERVSDALRGVCDVLGYPVGLGYAPPADEPGGWAPTVWETRETVRVVPEVTIPARDVMFPPDVIMVRDASGAVTARGMTEAERAACDAPSAGRAPIVDALSESRDMRPDDNPLRGDMTSAGVLMSYKPIIPSRKRVGSNTGPTIPARLSR